MPERDTIAKIAIGGHLALLLPMLYLLGQYCAAPGLFEIREYAESRVAQNIASGAYFSLASFPDNLYLYGPLPAFIVAFFDQTILANRLTSLVFMSLILLPIYLAVKSVLPAAARSYRFAVSLFIFSLIITSNLFCLIQNAGRPDLVGLFFYCSGLALGLVQPQFEVKNPAFALAIAILWLALLTKQYYGIIFLFFISNNYNNWRTCAALCLALGLFFILTYFWLPVYFLSWAHHLNIITLLPYSRSLEQFGLLFGRLNIFALALAVLLAIFWRRLRKSGNKILLIYTGLICLLLLLSMGRHFGNYLVYYTELLLPCLALLYLLCLPYLCKKLNYCLMLVCLLTVCVPQLVAFGVDLKAKEMNASYNVPATVLIYACPAAFYDPALRKSQASLDSGQMEFMDTIAPPVAFLGELPLMRQATSKIQAYRQRLVERLASRHYDLVIYNILCLLRLPEYKKALQQGYEEKQINEITSFYQRKAD